MKRLYRSKNDRMIAGVCAGIAEYFDIDPVLVRALFAVSAFMGGMGIVLYILLAIITPEEGEVKKSETGSVSGEVSGPAKIEEPPLQLPQMNQDKRWMLGLAIVGLGVFLLLGTLPSVIPWWGWHFMWPMILIGIGLYVFSRYRTKE